MSEIPKEKRRFKHIIDLPICWIKKQDQYRLHTQSKGNNLPVIDISKASRKALEEFGAAYREVELAKERKYEYWNKDFYETEKLTLPTYMFIDGLYCYIGENTLDNPTRKTLEEAKKVEECIKDYLLEEKNKALFQSGQLQYCEGEDTLDILKQILEDKYSCYISSMDFEEDEEYETEEDHFYVFVLKTQQCKLTGHVLLFNTKKMTSGMKESKVEVEVPKEDIRYICGRNGNNLKRWCKKMGIRKIYLKGV